MGYNQYNKVDTDLFKEKLNKKFPNKFKVIGNYVNSVTKIEILCLKCNNTFNIRPSCIMSRGKCPSCSKLNKKPRINTWNRISKEDFKTKFNNLVKDEYSLLSDYTKAEDYIKIRHNICGYEWNVISRNFISPSQMSRCPNCMRKYSSQEKDILNYIKSIYNKKIIENDRTQIYPLELDIYIPEKQLAIEYNGTYWHLGDKKDKNYHYHKSKLCEEKGIRLIHIFEYEWFNKRQRPILENIIKNALGLNNKIYARKLNIEIKPSKEMKDFFNENNIQGFRPR